MDNIIIVIRKLYEVYIEINEVFILVQEGGVENLVWANISDVDQDYYYYNRDKVKQVVIIKQEV